MYSIQSQCFVRDLDFNPNKDYTLCTGGDDGKVKLWDTRKTDRPTKVLLQHSHWVWGVQYNRTYDQLLLSCSGDCSVNLWNAHSLSSANSMTLAPKPGDTLKTPVSHKLLKDAPVSTVDLTSDHLIKCFEDHEDSVYSVAWSSVNPWLFASLSYDGRVVVNRVPKEYSDPLLFAQ
jgi:WD40 repeat protein